MSYPNPESNPPQQMAAGPEVAISNPISGSDHFDMNLVTDGIVNPQRPDTDVDVTITGLDMMNNSMTIYGHADHPPELDRWIFTFDDNNNPPNGLTNLKPDQVIELKVEAEHATGEDEDTAQINFMPAP